MPTCPRCSADNKDDALFCYSCGAALAPPPAASVAVPPPPPPGWGRPRQRPPDYLGLVGLALFLFVLGLVFYANPSLGTDLKTWVDQASRSGPFFRPPEGIISSAVLFFLLMGLSGFATSLVRFAMRGHRLRAISDALGGIGLLFLAFFLTLYADRTISGQLTLALWVAVLGVLLLIYIALGLYYTWVRVVPRRVTDTAPRP